MTLERLRVPLSLLVVGMSLFFTLLTGKWLAPAEAGNVFEVIGGGVRWEFVLSCAAPLAAVVYLQWWDVGLFRRPSPDSLKLLWLPGLYIIALQLLSPMEGLPPPEAAFFICLNMFFVSCSEELLFRGILLQAFQGAMRYWSAVWISTIIFGASHLPSHFLSGSDPFIAGVHTISATLQGLLYIAIRVRTASLVPGIALHWLWNSCVFLNQGYPTTLLVLYVVSIALYGIWLLGRASRDK